MRERIDWPKNPGINVDDSVNTDNGSSSTVIKNFIKNINQPLPWFALIAILCGLAVYNIQYKSNERMTLLADRTAKAEMKATEAANAAENARRIAWDAETEEHMLREYVKDLQLEVARYGIKPPPEKRR